MFTLPCAIRKQLSEKLVFIDLTSKLVSSLWNNLLLIIATRIWLLACCCGPSGRLFSSVLFNFASGTSNWWWYLSNARCETPVQLCSTAAFCAWISERSYFFRYHEYLSNAGPIYCADIILKSEDSPQKSFNWLMKFYTPLTSIPQISWLNRVPTCRYFILSSILPSAL